MHDFRGAAMKMLTKTKSKSTVEQDLIGSSAYYNGTCSPGLHVPYRLALIDWQGNVVAVNNDWKTFADESGADPNRIGPGVNYLEVCRQASAICPDSRRSLAGIHAVLKQRSSSFAMDYVCETPFGPASFHMDVTSLAYKEGRVAIAHQEITERQLSSEKNVTLLQQFARRLIHAQEDERQRISSEIHDDLGNRVALMALSIRQIIDQKKEHPGRFHDLNRILDEIGTLSNALRDLSHGLQPPVLRYAGIGPALRWLCEKFGANGIDVDLAIPEELPRLPEEKELCIFRIAQESLQNVVKHSGAGKVRIALDYEPHHAQLTIFDNGRGFIRSEAIDRRGLGLLSMEARALCVRGRLVVASSPGIGTTVRLRIPLQEE
jgi:two-component system, NarL family, sensor kinase